MAASAFAGCSNSGSSEAASSAATAETSAAETKAEATTEAAATEASSDATASAVAADITGVWITTNYITADGTTYTTEEYAEKNGVELDAVSVAYTFSADGKTTCTYGEASVEGTYTFDGTKLQTTFEGSAPLFEYSAEKDILVSADEATGITTVLGRVND